MSEFIRLDDAAKEYGISYKTLLDLIKEGVITLNLTKVTVDNKRQRARCFNRAEFMAFIEANPFKRQRADKVVKHKTCFEYSGHAKNVILFCQPALLNRGHTYEETIKNKGV